MKFKYKNLTPPPISAFSAKIKVWGFAWLLLGFITVLQSCAPTHEISPIERKQELLVQAQRLYRISVANARSARLSTTGSNARDIDVSLLFPDWDINGMKQNSKSQDVLGVLLKNNAKEYWEVDFIFTDGKAQMIFKKYTLKDGCLTIYNRYGQFLEKGRYFADTKQYSRFITRASLTKQARVSSEDPEMVDEGELDIEVNVRPEEDHSNDGAPGEGGIDMGGGSDSGSSQDSDLSGNLFPVDPISITVNIPINFNPTFVNPNEQTTDYSLWQIERNPCYSDDVKSIIKAATNTEMGDIIRKYEGEGKYDPRITIRFTSLYDYNTDAETQTYNESGVVSLNTPALGNADDAYLTATVLHEILHIYTPGGNDEDHKTWLNNGDGKGSFDKLVSAIAQIAGISNEEARALCMFGVKDKLTPEEDKINESHKKGQKESRNNCK